MTNKKPYQILSSHRGKQFEHSILTTSNRIGMPLMFCTKKTNVNSLAQWNSTTLIGPCRLDNTFFLANKL
jgi:hypothetical protein